jgi:hypothetical protein
MIDETMTIVQFLDRPPRKAQPRRALVFFRIPGGKRIARLVGYILN